MSGKAVRRRSLSIVVPTLNAAAGLAPTLDSLDAGAAPLDVERVVVDGGSTDGTVAIARGRGAVVIRGPRGRGRQLHAGAEASSGEWLLFLHADTCLAADWARAVCAFIAEPANRERAAAFRLAFDDEAPAARRLERLVAWRCRRLGLPYGDQGLLIGRARYRDIGGFRPLPFLEDVDLVRRQGRARMALLDATATTSSERHRRRGYVRQGMRNLLLVALFFAGVAPRHLARFYR